ncbi:septin-6 [Capsaspora owczarzaki ATCC 30864]|uniref:septin-6 n=1 Tax=Capsaspora owczarzaki (strain ATCC 30864) TaxID=595528 RepID=UPI0001FE34B8|nr:septin-6 [Capsaspora owczarzaki ATCC 30864]|eukprot:XP_004340465.1 septin-6 [Capsaspora owczarzaki ATCC 30864]
MQASSSLICESGIGKHTLVDSLFKTNFEHDQLDQPAKAVTLTSNTYELNETGVDLRLSVTHSRGFGDQVNNADGIKPIVDFVDARFDEFLQQEFKPSRDLKSWIDTRIHACLYLLTPTGHSIKSIDLLALKELSTRVNIILVIAKSDTVSRSELDEYKQRILNELDDNNIKLYSFPTDDSDDVAKLNEKLNAEVPFAVVGSRTEANLGGQRVRVRQYPWGIVEVENEAHSDFPKLREMLIRTNMDDLIGKTHHGHYEHFRQQNFSKLGLGGNADSTVSEAYNKKLAEHEAEKQRIEEAMRQTFVARVKDKDTELQRAGLELNQRFEKQMRQVKEQLKEFEEQDKRISTELEAIRAAMADLNKDKKKDKKTK